MKYTLANGRTIQIPDAEIEKLQKILDISKDEAIHTYLVDNDYEEDEIVEELTAKAKKNIKRYEKAEKTESKPRKPREKKVDEVKRRIISEIAQHLAEYFVDTGEVSIENPEKYIQLRFNDDFYTINLVKHRKKN